MPLYIACIDLTKAFDLVSRDCLFKFLPKIGCPPKLQSMIEYVHTYTKGTVQFNGSSSEPFEIRSGVKQGCVLAPTLFGVFVGLLLKHAFDKTTAYGTLFTLARLRAKTKVRKLLIREMLFADDAAVATHIQEDVPPVITIDNYELDAVCQFNHIGSTITDNLSLDSQIDNKSIGKAASTLARLTARVWTSPELSVKTNMRVYNACVTSTLLYGSETWTIMPGRREGLTH